MTLTCVKLTHTQKKKPTSVFTSGCTTLTGRRYSLSVLTQPNGSLEDARFTEAANYASYGWALSWSFLWLPAEEDAPSQIIFLLCISGHLVFFKFQASLPASHFESLLVTASYVASIVPKREESKEESM